MSEAIQFAVLGLATGSLYSLLGLGIIVAFRSSGVVNFAHGGIAVFAGYIYFDARSQGFPTLASVGMGLISGILLGLIIYIICIRALGSASTLTKGIATLAALVVLQSAITLHFGSTPVIALPFLPQNTVDVLGAAITVSNLITFGICIVLVVVLARLYSRTAFGIATSAVSENQFVYSLLGRSSSRLAAVNWMVAGGLAALAGVLIAPLMPVSPTEATILLIPALAIGLCGGFRSFWIALASAIAIGIGQSELSLYSNSGPLVNLTGLSEALPFVVIIIVLAARGRSLPSRDFVNLRLPRVGSGRLSRAWMLAWALLALILILSLSDEWVLAITTGVVSAVLLLSLVVVTGYAGQLSLAQVSVAGVGVLVASKLVASFGWPMPIAAVVGIAATLPVAFLIGLPALRTRGIMLAVVTLGLADALNSMVFLRNDVNGNGVGLTVGSASFFGWHVNQVSDPRSYALFSLVILTIVAFGVANLRRSKIGKQLVAVRANERASAALGVNVTASKLYAFVVAGGIAGVGGILAAWEVPVITFSTGYDPLQSINAVVSATLAGIGYISGAIVGGQATQPAGVGGILFSAIGLNEWLPLVAAALLLVTIVINPSGIVPNTLDSTRRLIRRLASRFGWLGTRMSRGRSRLLGKRHDASIVFDSSDINGARATVGDVRLEVRNMTVAFGASTVVNDVSFDCKGGEILSIIGPNGAGKTVLIDAITGYVKSNGTVTLNSQRMDGLSAYRRGRSGISRSFQSLELFEELSVVDNLLVGSERSGWWDWITCLFWAGRPRTNEAVRAAVLEFGLVDVLSRSPAELPYGERRLLAICRALTAAPMVLLLDEPAAGLDDRDRHELRRLVRRLADDWGMAIVMIEHDVELVMDISDRVIALEFGKKIAEDRPAVVREDPEVVRSYLGSPEETAGIEGTAQLTTHLASPKDAP